MFCYFLSLSLSCGTLATCSALTTEHRFTVFGTDVLHSGENVLAAKNFPLGLRFAGD